jgi:hypothetical protein
LGAGLVLRLGACVFEERLPAPGDVDPALLAEPIQTDTTKPPFELEKGGIRYRVEPVAEYELAGLVVSSHRADSFIDLYHDLWNDRLNAKDLCVAWGENVRSGVLRKIEFSSSDFTCDWRTWDSGAWSRFRQNQVSNNHLLAVDEELLDRLLSARPGDQIRFRGQLATYSNDRGFHRGTSTSRDDTAGGACETVWVTEFEFLERAHPFARAIAALGKLLFLVGLVLGIWDFFRRPVGIRAASSEPPLPPPWRRPPLPDRWPGESGGETSQLPERESGNEGVPPKAPT